MEYIAGVVKGDGTFYYYKKTQEYSVEIYERDEEFVGVLVKLLRSCGFNPHVSKRRGYYRAKVNSTELFHTLKELIGRLLEKPTASFVAGLLDSDGTLYFDRRKKTPCRWSNWQIWTLK